MPTDTSQHGRRRSPAPSTVGRGRAAALRNAPRPESEFWSDGTISVSLGDSLNHYARWPAPAVIISDGGYGILGFEGDTSGHLDLPAWYETHIAEWSRHATPSTTLWFWNSEIGWAAVHPVLERYGWRYINANVWNKGKGHIAGNVNTTKIRRFPVVSELCVQYAYQARVDGLELKHWLLREWKRTGLPMRKCNEACGVADAATRKYLDQGHLWYFPPPEVFEKMARYANLHGSREGRPYFSLDGLRPATAAEWAGMRAKFYCPHGYTNVWDRGAVNGNERFRADGHNGKAVHLNQKPIDLTAMIIRASSDRGDVVWEPFGGLFTGCLAAANLGRLAFGAEIDPTYFAYAVRRLSGRLQQSHLPGLRDAEQGPSE